MRDVGEPIQVPSKATNVICCRPASRTKLLKLSIAVLLDSNQLPPHRPASACQDTKNPSSALINFHVLLSLVYLASKSLIVDRVAHTYNMRPTKTSVSDLC